ncbi:hypothetical protein EBB79_13205 [Parasedimentitalea marina]|uniref:Uncharacterized protein n=1 Tax=Parasedimentitalea marina TaxID=2483033 RepID=A0A3T0N416_9RHOB|nr:hypothetical protein [Parasedimentitalea marina]AZV78734.1 hypothetical protein EBB79_13205 [Parasedimentitalea marina]
MADSVGKDLLGPVITMIGWMTPIVIGLIAIGRNPSISTEIAGQIWYSMFAFLVIYACAISHIVICAIDIWGRRTPPVSPFFSFLATFMLFSMSVIYWIAIFLIGFAND